MKKSILITMLCILGLAATAQTYDTIYNRAANGYYYHWYDTCEDGHFSFLSLSRTDGLDTTNISCVSHYTPEPMMITGGIIWVSDEMYTRPGTNWSWLHDYRPYPEYIMLYQYDAWRDRMVFVDSARWDTATPKIMKLPKGPNPERTGYVYCYGYEAHFKNPVMVDTTFVMGGTHNNVNLFDDFLFWYKPFYYVYLVKRLPANCPGDTTWQYTARYGWETEYVFLDGGNYGGVIPTVDTFRLEVATNDSSHGSVSGSGTFANMSWHTIAASATPGYRFSHWNDGNHNNPRQIQIRQDTTFTAFFVERGEVWADVWSNNEDFGTTTGGGMYYEGDTATLTATPMPLHKFLYWDDSVTDNPRYVELTQDTFLTAIFAPLDRYRVVAGDNNTGRGHVEGGGTYYEGDTVTLTALPWMTFRFLQWDDGIRDNPRSFVVTQDTVFNALFVSEDGIEEAESGDALFQLSPNPTTGDVRCVLYSLPTHGGSLTVLDALGHEVLRQRVEPYMWSATLPTSHLPQGVYFVTLTTVEKTCTQKLVVE